MLQGEERQRIRALIVDDEPLALSNLRVLLARDPGVEIVGECGSGIQALEDLRTRRAEAIADAMLKPTTHSMELEDQGVSKRTRQRQRKELIDTLLTGSARKLWR